MPVRSLTSCVFAWPDAETVDRAVRTWAARVAQSRPQVRRIGYFGSYARGDWGVGSDVDIVVVVTSADLPFERRPAGWDVTALPVPADVLVYTEEEWRALDRTTRFGRTLAEETRWVHPRPEPE